MMAMLIAGAVFALAPVAARAADNCIDLSLESTPLFGDRDVKPGDRIIKTAVITNVLSASNNIRVWAESYFGAPNPANVPADDLARVLNLTIRIKNGADLFGGSLGQKTLYDFFASGQFLLDTIGANQTREYELEIYFDPALGNEWQKKTTKFDIAFNSECGSNGGGNGNGGNGGGQTSGGGATSGGGIGGQFSPAIAPRIAGAADEKPDLVQNLKDALGVATGVFWPEKQGDGKASEEIPLFFGALALLFLAIITAAAYIAAKNHSEKSLKSKNEA